MVSPWRPCPPAYRSRRARSTKACWCSWAECIKRVPTGTNGRRRSRDRRPAPALSGSNLPGPDGLSTTSMGASDPVRLAQAGDQDAFHALYREHVGRSEEHTSELQSQSTLVCRLLLEKKKQKTT